MAKSKNETIVTVDEVLRARKSVNGRLRRLRRINSRWGGGAKTPIAEIGVFDDEIQQMEDTLRGMADRINNAKVIL